MACNCKGSCNCSGIVTAKGQRGLPGIPGATPSLSFTVTGLSPDTAPIASQSGTVLNPILNLGIPSGQPGTPGAPGTPGVAGGNTYTNTNTFFVQPSVSGSVVVLVNDTSWAILGEDVFVYGGGYYKLVGKSTTSLVLVNLGYTGNATVGTVVSATALVGPSGVVGAQGPAGAPGTNGSPGPSGTTPVLHSGSGVPSNVLGVDGDWYAQQVNSGQVLFYSKSGGAYTTQGSVTGNRLFVFTADPNTLSIDANNRDQGTWVSGSTVSQYSYDSGTSTWTLFNTYDNAGSRGPGWAFYATKTISQPVDGTSGSLTKVNFEDDDTGMNFNNSGAWSLNTYTFADSLTKSFTATNIVASRTGTTGDVTAAVTIVKNNVRGTPIATGTLTIANGSSTGTLGLVTADDKPYAAGDTVSVFVTPGTAIPGLIITGGQFFIG